MKKPNLFNLGWLFYDLYLLGWYLIQGIRNMSVCTTLSLFHQTAFKPVHQVSIKFEGGKVLKTENSRKLYEKR